MVNLFGVVVANFAKFGCWGGGAGGGGGEGPAGRGSARGAQVKSSGNEGASPDEVQRAIRLLERRCQTPDLHQRLHATAQKWRDNGGALTAELTEALAESIDTAPETVEHTVNDAKIVPCMRVFRYLSRGDQVGD